MHDDFEGTLTKALAPQTPEQRRARRLASVAEAIETAKRITEPGSNDRLLLVSVLHRLRRYEEQFGGEGLIPPPPQPDPIQPAAARRHGPVRPSRYLIERLDEILDRIPTREDGRWGPSGLGCRLGLNRWWLRP